MNSILNLFQLLTNLLVNLTTGLHMEYKASFEIPFFTFVRDAISYLVLLVLHLALSVESSQLSFSGLEWAILVFFAGRLLTEMKQIIYFAKKPSEHKITGLSKRKDFIITYTRYK